MRSSSFEHAVGFLLMSAVVPYGCAPALTGAANKSLPENRPNAQSDCVEVTSRSAATLADAMYRLGKAISIGSEPDGENRATAAQQFRGIIVDHPWFAPGYRGLGIVEATRGNWVASYTAYKHYLHFAMDKAERNMVRDELSKLEKKHPALRAYAHGEQAAAEADWPRVIDLMSDVIAQRPTFSLAYRLLGIAYASRARATQAIEAYRAYLDLDKYAPDQRQVEAIIDKTTYALEKRARRRAGDKIEANEK